MNKDSVNCNNCEVIATKHDSESPKQYHKPELVVLGDLRSITLGASKIGTIESDDGLGNVTYWPS